MGKTLSLDDHKSKKKAAVIANELEQAVKVMDLAMRGLAPFSKYIQVMETLSCIKNNKTLLDIHLSKYKRLIEKTNEDSLEESPE